MVSDDCVEVEIGAMEITVRDSRQDGLTYDQPVLHFDFEAWRKFIEGVKEGMFDVPNTIPIQTGVITAGVLQADVILSAKIG